MILDRTFIQKQGQLDYVYEGIYYIKLLKKWNILLLEHTIKKYDFGFFNTEHEAAYGYNLFVEHLNEYYNCQYKLNTLRYNLDKEIMEKIKLYINFKLNMFSDDLTSSLIHDFIYG